MERYVCIHGHFYQPPRENPWLGEVELQDSAYPYHDWNDKITEQCYRQNTASRILGPDKQIIDIVNNYSKISFNFGPTLLSWLERHAHDVYDSILEADRESLNRFAGHGAAIAQPYNHIIMPLANERDKRTEVVWGIRDFEYRFGRKPEGMWLPETAVDIPTLEVLAEHGIKFTILAPRQAGRIRKIGGRKWTTIENEKIDTRRPYLCNLPSGRTITLFFFDSNLARDVAYGGLLNNGENFAAHLVEAFSADSAEPQLVNIANDGESYGHHHRYGDMALAYCLHRIESQGAAKLAVYGQFLEMFPPTWEVEIAENTSWSCVHGIERWRSNCGCTAGRYPPGQQQWRKVLRDTLDWLRDSLVPLYEQMMSNYVADPWKLRDDYIYLILDRSPEKIEAFINNYVGHPLNAQEKVTFLKLLEMQRNALLMFTSCGWFFDDIGGLEAIQVLQYAARSIQLVRDIKGNNLEDELKSRLQRAPANYRPGATAKDVYEEFVEPANVDLNRVGAHFAISSLFQDYGRHQDIFCYSAETELYDRIDAGVQKLAVGRTTVRCNIVMQKYAVDFAVLHLGEHNIIGAVASRMPDQDFDKLYQSLKDAFSSGNTTEVIRLMNIGFAGNNYSLWHLFKDEQRRILFELLENTLQEVEASFRHIYEHNFIFMNIMRSMNIPLPKAFLTPAEFILNHDIVKIVQQEKIDIERLRAVIDVCSRFSLRLEETSLLLKLSRRINSLMGELEKKPDDTELVETIESVLGMLQDITGPLDLQAAQNLLFSIARQRYDQARTAAQSGDENASKWLEHFEKLANYLGVRVRQE